MDYKSIGNYKLLFLLIDYESIYHKDEYSFFDSIKMNIFKNN